MFNFGNDTRTNIYLFSNVKNKGENRVKRKDVIIIKIPYLI